MQSRHALAKDVVLADQYRVDTVLGAGGFGITYLAEDTGLGSTVVVKEYFPAQIAVRDQTATVHPRAERDERIYQWGRERFVREARILDACRHPHIVRVRRVFEANNTAYMALDFENGPNLDGWLQALARTPTQGEIDAILWPLLDALAYLHDLKPPVIHRDIAPDNIIMRDGNHPVLIDFGAARVEAAGRAESRVSAVKDGYSPREQYAQRPELQGPWTDIYAMAATIRRAITGERPPDSMGRDLDDTMQSLTAMELPGFRPAFLAALDAAMRVQHGARPQSVATWREMLFAGADSAPQVARAVSRPRAQASASPPVSEPQTARVERPVIAQIGAPDAAAARSDGKGQRTLLLGLAGVVVLGIGMGMAHYLRRPATTTSTATPAVAPVSKPVVAPGAQVTPAAVAQQSGQPLQLRQACERLARPPSKDHAGVHWEDLDAAAAAAACDPAARANPDDPRLEAWLGRTLAKARNFGAARQWLERAANKGEAYGQFHLGVLFAEGQGVPRDFGKAREWYEKAVAQNEPHALNTLGHLHESGRGGAIDLARAREHYERSAALGHPQGMVSLGQLFENARGVAVDFGRARELYEIAARSGYSGALNALGNLTNNGRGVTADPARAAALFEQAVAKGNASAMNNLALLLDQGRGVAQDLARAKDLYEQAAERGNAFAMSNLGWFYEQGRGVTQDYARAREWYEKAAERGNARAMNNLGTLYGAGRGVAQDPTAARGWYEKAAERGDPSAAYNLAPYLDQGRGGARDTTRAARLLLQAARAGSNAAQTTLAGPMTRWSPDTVRALQTQLQASGHYRGALSGTWDAASQAAARAHAEARS